MLKKNIIFTAFIAIMLILGGCNNGGGGGDTSPNNAGDNNPSQNTPPPQQQANPDPVTLVVAVPGWADTDFDEYFVPAVKEAHPHITLDKATIGGGEQHLETDIITKGLKPDIIITSSEWGPTAMKTLKLDYPLDDLVKAYNYDLNRFEDYIMELARNRDSDPDLTVIPYMRNVEGLYYNKEIFDRFAVDYPEDNSTWDELIVKARRLTQLVDGVQYRGLEPDTPMRVSTSLGLTPIDATTHKPAVNNDGWKKVLQMYQQVYSINGNEERVWFAEAWVKFQEGTLAMLAGLNFGNDALGQGDIDWDVSTYPVFEPGGNTLSLGTRALAITSYTEHADAAFQAISAMTTNEVMMKLSGAGKGPVVNDNAIRANFGSEIPWMKGKNLESIFKADPALPALTAPYPNGKVNWQITVAIDKLLEGTDINTVLRQAEENLQAIIDETNISN